MTKSMYDLPPILWTGYNEYGPMKKQSVSLMPLHMVLPNRFSITTAPGSHHQPRPQPTQTKTESSTMHIANLMVPSLKYLPKVLMLDENKPARAINITASNGSGMGFKEPACTRPCRTSYLSQTLISTRISITRYPLASRWIVSSRSDPNFSISYIDG